MTQQTTPRLSSRGLGSGGGQSVARATATAHRSGDRPLVRALAAATAALLAVDSFVHVTDASLYDSITTSTISEGTLFRIEALVALLVAVALLIQPRPAVWAVAAVVAASAAGAVLLSTYVDLGPLGPLPDMYEPTWALAGKAVSAVAEIAATVLALAGLTLALRARRREAT